MANKLIRQLTLLEVKARSLVIFWLYAYVFFFTLKKTLQNYKTVISVYHSDVSAFSFNF